LLLSKADGSGRNAIAAPLSFSDPSFSEIGNENSFILRKPFFHFFPSSWAALIIDPYYTMNNLINFALIITRYLNS